MRINIDFISVLMSNITAVLSRGVDRVFDTNVIRSMQPAVITKIVEKIKQSERIHFGRKLLCVSYVNVKLNKQNVLKLLIN